MEHGKAACMHHYQYHMVLITMNIDCSCLHSISSKRSALPRCYSVLPYYFYSLFSQSFLWFPERLLYVYFNISLVLPLLINTAVTLLECALLLSFDLKYHCQFNSFQNSMSANSRSLISFYTSLCTLYSCLYIHVDILSCALVALISWSFFPCLSKIIFILYIHKLLFDYLNTFEF